MGKGDGHTEGAAFGLATQNVSDEDTRRKPEWDPSAGGREVQVEWASEQQYRTVGGMPDRECVQGGRSCEFGDGAFAWSDSQFIVWIWSKYIYFVFFLERGRMEHCSKRRMLTGYICMAWSMVLSRVTQCSYAGRVARWGCRVKVLLPSYHDDA